MNKIVKFKMFITIFCMVCFPIICYASEDFFVPSYSEEYERWLELSDEEKQNVIEPQMYEIPCDEEQIQMLSLEEDENVGAFILPSKFSRSDYGEVKNQESNLCWACSSATVFGTNYYLTNSIKKQFSDLHMEYMTTRTYNVSGFNRAYNTGGNINIALAYATNGMGIVLDDNINSSNFKNAKQVAKVSDYDTISSNDLKKYIYNSGCITAYTNTSTSFYSNSNVWNNDNLAYYCNNTSLTANHAVTLIGWDDNYTNSAFPNLKGAFIVLNSYGSSFGKNGLYYIFYEDAFIKNKTFYAVTKTDDINYNNLYQYDEYGQTAAIGWGVQEGGTYAANIFSRSTSKSELLKEIGICIPTSGTLKVYINNGTNLDINKSEYGFTTENLTAGYHTIKMPKQFELNKDKFTVCVKYSGYMGAEVSSTSSKSWYFTVTANRGESFVSIDGTNWKDLKEKVPDRKVNACIKVFTDVKKEENVSKQISNEYTGYIENYTFDYKYYADNNPDLIAAFGYNEKLLKNHWNSNGKLEGRCASPIFDARYYLENNSDLKKALGNNYLGAYYHFINNGCKEFRKSSYEYDGNFYRENNIDLKNLSSAELIRHYMSFGRNEERQASSNCNIEKYLFVPEVYRAMNPDLENAFGNNVDQLKVHWKNYGISEGRIASYIFDVEYYLNTYKDLKSAFGNNYYLAYQHFVNFGFSEGRQGSSVFSAKYYLDNNLDLKNIYNSNYFAGLKHFLNCGVNEFRNTSSIFNVAVYRARNDDLNIAFGNNSKLYYNHYLKFGKNEKRISF